MDSKEKGFNTIDLSDLSFSGSMADSISVEPLTISSISLTDYNVGAIGPSGPIGGAYTLTSASPNTIWTTSGSNGSWIGSAHTAAQIKPSGTIELKGENADIVVNEKSLMKTLEAIEQRLNILTANQEMEAEWDELRELGERYRELEKKCLEKSEVWKKLKSMPPPEIE